MRATDFDGMTDDFIQTVTGPIPANELGVTMPHEHVLVLNPSFVEPLEASERHRAYEPVSEADIEWVRQYWTSNVDNLELYDENVARDGEGRLRILWKRSWRTTPAGCSL